MVRSALLQDVVDKIQAAIYQINDEQLRKNELKHLETEAQLLAATIARQKSLIQMRKCVIPTK